MGRALKKEETININQATLEELLRVPWVGQDLAAAIIRYRATRGPFLSLEELREVGDIHEQHLSYLKKKWHA